MKNILLFILFLSNFCFAQSHRFIYEYKFVADSTKSDSIIVENTRLEIFKDHSEFVSDLNAIRDSLSATRKNIGDEDGAFPIGNYKNIVYKSKELNYSLEFVGIQPFKVLQNEKLNWELLKETKNIQGYHCQKAIINFGKRNWIAWFTQEIPLQEGPSVFGNLPGLIIQINDEKNQHSFSLIANYKTANVKTNIIERPYLLSATITRSQFNKKWNIYRNNPIGGTEQFMIMNPGLLSGKSFDAHGNEMDLTQAKREELNYAKRLIGDVNNYLDLELYK
ncbi:GLPGLI family protein [Kaistella flava (ex Peng et al. 2021)]|uniref:GLPGLI family protein n=1 Tax=Kaistella flava (ex Peng et al. 2021) TaxID=2038776 RepID=A0A7M2Y6H1_9FLAO|nr:GLPGLI family protein [Kaistella flava (ex Peng et al. 2021)]QOW09847.1 GLPGLI family protein [Kaistella flava (ex Peng et al. 2021)]